jgi:muramidase (phage lysozyme)/LysM repeat protein
MSISPISTSYTPDLQATLDRLAPAKLTGPASPINTFTYKIRPGDTLSELGQRFGVPWKDIQALNGLSGTLIKAGETLEIPIPTGGKLDALVDRSATQDVQTMVHVLQALVALLSQVQDGEGAQGTEGGPDAPTAPTRQGDGPLPKSLLDLIGKTEGTDKGDGYNETLAYGAYTGGDVNLTGMTLGEIDDLQTQMLAHPDNKWNSSAIGRYQIVRTTLRNLKDKLGLSDDMKFTPQLQDRLATELLKGRGLDEWRAGRMSDSQFAANLSKEWASLPNPTTNKGAYAGQHAAVGISEVQQVLNLERKA